MKKALAGILSLTLALALTACGGAGVEPETPNDAAPSESAETAPQNAGSAAPSENAEAAPDDAGEIASLSGVADDAPQETAETPAKSAQTPNPFQDYATYEEAADAAQYGFAAPQSVDGYPEVSYSVMNGGEMFQIVYRNGDGGEVTARKAPGDQTDISGDYNQYAEERIVDTAALTFTVKGDGEKAFVALWMDDDSGFSYSLTAKDGMSPDAFEALVVAIQDAEAE